MTRLLGLGAAIVCGLLIVACSGSSSTKQSDAPAAWTSYGHDLANTRTNAAEKAIDVSTVAGLTQSWSKDGLVGLTGTPVVSDGIAYFGDWQGAMWAVDARTGQQVWKTQLGSTFIGSPAVAGNFVYAASGKTLYGLDLKTGKVSWSAVTNDNNFSQINSSPIVVDNLVIIGTAQFEEVVGNSPFTFRGSIGAWDRTTGKQVWNFYTTPNDATSGSGEGIWGTPAVSTKLGLLYIGTGPNLSEPPGPLADALLAIDYKTGTLKWSHQFNKADIFSRASNFSGKNADIGASPNLWTTKGSEIVGVGSKNGTYYALDAATGKIQWETPMTAGSVFGGALGSAALVDNTIIASSNIGDPKSNGNTNFVKIFAISPDTGKVLWSKKFDGNVFGPVSAVQGLAFFGTDKNKMYALDTKTGDVAWSFTPPDKVGGGAAIVNGEVLWGYGFTLFSGPGKGGMLAFNLGGAKTSTP